jgi:hypothetical protein
MRVLYRDESITLDGRRQQMVSEKQKAGRCPKRLDHVVWKVIDGKGILLNLESSAYFEVNPVGLSIWQWCDGTKTTGQIAGQIACGFDANPKRAEKDLGDFISDLKRRKLVEMK